jgi:hypothetical protein
MLHMRDISDCLSDTGLATCLSQHQHAHQVLRGCYSQEKDTIRLRREAKQKGGFYVEPESKLAFVVRIRGLNKIHPKVSPASAAPSPVHGWLCNDDNCLWRIFGKLLPLGNQLAVVCLMPWHGGLPTVLERVLNHLDMESPLLSAMTPEDSVALLPTFVLWLPVSVDEEDLAAAAPASDQQRRVCQGKQQQL